MNTKNKSIKSWFLRFIKGIFIGSGFILPGVSGGAMAAVFGIYEKLISFIAHITKNFKENFIFFLPVALGGIFGVFLLAFPVSYLLIHFEVQVLWFFIGCIIGTLPALWKQAKRDHQKPKHIVLMFIVGIISAILLLSMNSATMNVSNAIVNDFSSIAWVGAGALIGLGILVPGLSPSNFLIFFGMYGSMSAAFKEADLSIIIPLAIGGMICVLIFSKLVDYILKVAHTTMFHIILGIVAASTLVIIPLDYNYLSIGTLVCIITFILGILLALWMSRIEEKYMDE
ncbi:MAG: DUF368 domain-containing protein [Erysipelotrichales bacterium]